MLLLICESILTIEEHDKLPMEKTKVLSTTQWDWAAKLRSTIYLDCIPAKITLAT